MKFHILTLFPQMFQGPLSESIIARAKKNGIIEIVYHNLRDYASDKHKSVDDTPCGGGAGMVLRVDIMDKAIKSIVNNRRDDFKIILMTPQGKRFDQNKAESLSKESKDILLICGHFEGFDERIRQYLIDEEISLGDFVMTGGEIAAMAIVDATTRLLPGVLGKDESSHEESFSLEYDGHRLLEYPIYTRPITYNNWTVPDILLSGNHKKIKEWRIEQAIKRTNEKSDSKA